MTVVEELQQLQQALLRAQMQIAVLQTEVRVMAEQRRQLAEGLRTVMSGAEAGHVHGTWRAAVSEFPLLTMQPPGRQDCRPKRHSIPQHRRIL